ncbi:MAG: hypothetical protein HKL82_05035 [Acidimicrobiaceae bacterium]|nr:hypothetical protein [Acidimicrobiaceae bacterium]
MTAVLGISQWRDSMLEATDEVAQSSLMLDAVTVREAPSPLPRDLPGSYIPLVGEDYNYEFGLAAKWEHCEYLAKTLLFMDPGDEISDDDIADAMNELANMVGGGVKKRMAEIDTTLKLGLPAFFNGTVHPTAEQEHVCVIATAGEAEIYLIALKHKAPL